MHRQSDWMPIRGAIEHLRDRFHNRANVDRLQVQRQRLPRNGLRVLQCPHERCGPNCCCLDATEEPHGINLSYCRVLECELNRAPNSGQWSRKVVRHSRNEPVQLFASFLFPSGSRYGVRPRSTQPVDQPPDYNCNDEEETEVHRVAYTGDRAYRFWEQEVVPDAA